MTCVGSRKEDIDAVASQLREANVKHVLALRGDRPSYMTDEQFAARDFTYASELTSYLKSTTDFTIAGGCYPEKHFEAACFEQDLLNLKKKCEAGAEYLISQLFFDNEVFFRFLDAADKTGITVPTHAGIMPITSAKQLGTTVSLSGSSVPKALADLIAAYGDSPEDMRKAGIDYAVRQIRGLQDAGVHGIHIYTMNKPKVAAEIVSGIR